jgi:sterol desaturase/sphingolipid hydroxylase (fatty acid hydroxylase superfamily)
MLVFASFNIASAKIIDQAGNPRHDMTNMASLFTVWDHLFGTNVDPDKVDTELSFGIGEQEKSSSDRLLGNSNRSSSYRE